MFVFATHHLQLLTPAFPQYTQTFTSSLYIVLFPTLPDNTLSVFVIFDIDRVF